MNRTLIEKIYGLNETGETEIKLGECPFIKNVRITDNYNAFQIQGYTALNTATTSPIRAIAKGLVDGSEVLITVTNGNAYTVNETTGALTSIGTLTDAFTHIFFNDDKAYFLNGNEYKYWDGTTFGDVADIAYEPLIATGTPPTGGGTDVEDRNILTGTVHQKFSGDASSATYVLREDDLDSDTVLVYVDGSTTSLIENTDFTVDRVNGTVTPTPVTNFTVGTSNIDIYWTKDLGVLTQLTSCRKAMEFETRWHFWGGDRQNIRFYSGLVDGNVSAEYIPAETVVGSAEITDIRAQYDRQIIGTKKGSYYSFYQDIDGEISFPVRDLNEIIGNNPFGQMQVIDNFPVSFNNGVYQWVNINVKDEKNAEIISTKVTNTYETFTEDDLITLDDEYRKELWISFGTKVLVFNYRNASWYYYEFPDTISYLALINNNVHMGTDNGEIMVFDEDDVNFNGTTIESEIRLSMYDWGEEWLRKFVREVFISVEPASKVNWDVYWKSDSPEEDGVEQQANVSIGYNVLDFFNIDFENFSFLTATAPTPQRTYIKARKCTYFQLILRNSQANATANVLSITILANIGGKSR